MNYTWSFPAVTRKPLVTSLDAFVSLFELLEHHSNVYHSLLRWFFLVCGLSPPLRIRSASPSSYE